MGQSSCPGWCRRAPARRSRRPCWPGRPSGAARWRARRRTAPWPGRWPAARRCRRTRSRRSSACRVALGVLVGQHRALRLQHRAADVVLGGDQLDLVVLAALRSSWIASVHLRVDDLETAPSGRVHCGRWPWPRSFHLHLRQARSGPSRSAPAGTRSLRACRRGTRRRRPGRSGRGRSGRRGWSAPRPPPWPRSASSMAACTAWADSGAGTIPSVRAKRTRRLEDARCGVAPWPRCSPRDRAG